MVSKLLFCWAVLLALTAWNIETVVDPYRLAPLKAAIPAQVDVKWMDCGQVNGFYHPPTKTIVMCNELRTLPYSVVRFVFAHELSHAFIHQNNVPYTGSEEWAADELAAVTLIEAGEYKAVEEVSDFHAAQRPDERITSDHPGNGRRALYLLCMAKQGGEGLTSDLCYVNYPRIRKAWLRLLGGV